MATIKLSPGEALVMEVLAARWRLGERLWTFDASGRRWLNSLMEKGLISVMHGIVENTLRASFTDEGLNYYWPKGAPKCGQAGEPTEETLTSSEQAVLSAFVQLKRANVEKLSAFIMEAPAVADAAVTTLLKRGLIKREKDNAYMFRLAG